MVKMNSRGDMNILMSNMIYVILVVLFLMLIFNFIQGQKNDAGYWEDFYASEVSKIISVSEGELELKLNVNTATEIARKNEVRDFDRLFIFDNSRKEVCVSLSVSGKYTCNAFFRNVTILDDELIYGAPENMLSFKIVEEIEEVEDES